MTLDHRLSLRGSVPAAAGSAAVAAAVLRRFSLGVIAYELLLAALIGGPVYLGCAAAAGAAYMLATHWSRCDTARSAAMRVADRKELASASASDRPKAPGQHAVREA